MPIDGRRSLTQFMKNHWILIVLLFLLILMSVPLLYFENFLKVLNRKGTESNFFRMNASPTIGICLDDLAETRWEDEKAIWVKEAEAQGLPIQIRIAHHSLERQIRQIKSFIRQNVKVLILVPVSRTGLTEVLKEATQKEIKIILYDELTDGPVDFYCGIDYREAGRIQATALVAMAGSGNYLLFRGPSSSYKAELLAQGQLNILREASRRKVRLLSVITLPDWSAEEAVLKTRIFIMHQKIKAILVPNDLVAQEISRFFLSQKLPAPFLGGIGTEASFGQRIKTGENLMTLGVDYSLLARTAFNIARQFTHGTVVKTNDTIKYGSQKVPAWLLRSDLILQSKHGE